MNSGVRHQGRKGQLKISSLDAPLVAPGQPALLRLHNRQPPLTEGMHVLLFNNLWGTNFTMWSAESGRFRFVLDFGQS
ncbi:MAG: hypothetical protein IPK16_19555 [Anaerolineales bacterium]|nr:hypothetical protein [Anaerolineales bacterium]